MCNDTDEEQSVDCAVIADYVNYDDGMGIESLPEYNAVCPPYRYRTSFATHTDEYSSPTRSWASAAAANTPAT